MTYHQLAKEIVGEWFMKCDISQIVAKPESFPAKTLHDIIVNTLELKDFNEKLAREDAMNKSVESSPVIYPKEGEPGYNEAEHCITKPGEFAFPPYPDRPNEEWPYIHKLLVEYQKHIARMNPWIFEEVK